MKQCVVIILLVLDFGVAKAQVGGLSYGGKIIDLDTEEPLAGVTVLLSKDDLQFEAVSDIDGQFLFKDIPAGFYQLYFESLGYQPKRVVEIELNTGIPRSQVFKLTPSEEILDEIVVKAESRSRSIEAVNSISTLTVEETFRFPGTFYDPARLATHYAGVISENDQANNLVIRGNSPNGLGWYLQGVEIVNPNHTSNAGTLNDRSSQSGGGVNILSAQMLDNSTFLTGAFPASYGNAISGIFDMQLREGAKDRSHFTGQIGLLGIDAAIEGPISPAKTGTYLVNYRYSTLGLLSSLGVDLGDEEINFQDLSFHLNWSLGKGSLSFFGLGGFSENIFRAPLDPLEREDFKDLQNISFKGRMGALGLQFLNQKWEHTIAYSGYNQHRFSELVNNSTMGIFDPFENDEVTEQRIGVHSRKKLRLNDGTAEMGIRANIIDYQVTNAQYLIGQDLSNTKAGFLLQTYFDARKSITPRLVLHGGMHFSTFTLNEALTIEPRVAFEFRQNEEIKWGFSYGLHSRMPSPNAFLISEQPGVGNTDLKFIRSHHLVLSNTINLSSSSKLVSEVYYQSLFNLPVAPGSSRSLATINAIDYIGAENLVSQGTGLNTGLEITFQQYFSSSTYFLLNGAIYDSKYRGADGIKRNTRYNGRYGFNLTGGKEIKWEKNNKLKVVGFNLRSTFFGGFWSGPIDVEESQRLLRTIYDEPAAFSEQLPDLFRMDFRVYYKRIKEKYTSILGLDILNATDQENASFTYYDPYTKTVMIKNQLGIIPNLSYRIEF
ncbi:MAG: TonB-dependent receptor [Saprospiraceae bacterium]|nr:TonB-dependent receptor [Saprospiraceae bacterium]